MKAQDVMSDGNPRPGSGPRVGWLVIATLLTILWAGAVGAAVVPSWPLNDTGIDWWSDGSRNHLAAPPSGYPGQDASIGRDATQDRDADGHAGFSFTKLDAAGWALAAGATAWSCVRDKVTGLIWEVKPDDGGLRDRDWTYSWYNPDATRNGGNAGTRNGGSCGGGIACDTLAFTQAVNRAGLCGARDWRLPNRNELQSVVDRSRFNPTIDTNYFPDVTVWDYWSSSPYVGRAAYAWLVSFSGGWGASGSGKNGKNRVRLVRGGQALSLDDHGNGISSATPIAIDSSTPGRINSPGDNDYFRLQVGTAGTLTLYTTGSTDTYGYLLNAAGSELTHNDDVGTTNRNFRITRSVSPGNYHARVRHASPSLTGAYTLVAEFTATGGTVQRAVLLLHDMNAAPDTWNTLVAARWSGQCPQIYAGVAPAPGAALPRDILGAVCYRLRFGRYDTTGAVGLENRRCATTGNPTGCKGDFSTIYAGATGNDLGLEVFAAVRAILARLGADTQVVLLGHGRGGLAARAFLERPASSAERRAVVGLVTTGTPHRGLPLGRLYAYLRTSCLDTAGRRITGSNRAGTSQAVWSACTADWQAVDFLETGLTGYGGLYLGKPTIAALAPGSTPLTALNAAAAVANLPADLSVVQLRYTGQYLGHLSAGYSAWNRPAAPQSAPQFSVRARNYALCANAATCGKTEDTAEFTGDGLVPMSAQTIPELVNTPVTGQSGTYHVTGAAGTVGEVDRVSNLGTALGRVRWR